jgi:NAD(P)-dependent dehydrogenase (short-subunit alcohol dehydrogenase family)
MAETGDSTPNPDVALIVGGGPGISASCARLFAREGLKVAVAALNIEKPVLQELAATHGVGCYGYDAAD